MMPDTSRPAPTLQSEIDDFVRHHSECKLETCDALRERVRLASLHRNRIEEQQAEIAALKATLERVEDRDRRMNEAVAELVRLKALGDKVGRWRLFSFGCSGLSSRPRG